MNYETLTATATLVEASNKSPMTVNKLIDESGNVDLTKLNESDKAKYSELASRLVTTDINSISNYGADLQNTMNQYSNDFLKAVRARSSGEVGSLINDLLGELSYIDVDELKEPNFFKKILRKVPIVNRFVVTLEKVLSKYDSIANNVDLIAKKIAVTRVTSLRDNNALQVMFENNIAYGKQIEDLIIGGKLKLAEVKGKLEQMQSNPTNYDANEMRDLEEFVHNLERRITDMLTLRYVIKQSLPQIRTVQYNNIAIADKAQSIIATTIPVWKNQLSIAIALQRQKDRVEAHRKISDTTNAILRKNAELLHQNSVNVAKENERSIVSIETLRDTTRELINTIKEVKQIHDEASAKRKQAEEEIMKIESELDTSLTNMNHNFY